MTEIKLPSLGEGVEKGTIVAILVQPGQTITREESILEVETDKVTTEVPCPLSGKISEIMVEVDNEISVGDIILTLTEVDADETNEDVQEMVNDILDEKPEPFENQPESASLGISSSETLVLPGIIPAVNTNTSFRSSPLAKKVAREIGVNIKDVVPKANGRITVSDVKDYAKQQLSGDQKGKTSNRIPLPSFESWGAIRREKRSGIMKATSRNMTTAWSEIPHAWLQEKVDITQLEESRQKHKQSVKDQGGSLTTTAILVKVVANLLKEFPIFNTSLDVNNDEIIFKEYINVGVAVDTEVGLVVPTLLAADQSSLTEISIGLNQLSAKAKQRKLSSDELQGATFTISNLGGIGTSGIFPIVNYPQVAILGVARAMKEPKWNEKSQTFEPKLILPLTIGFDHRVINGADAARFLQRVKEVLEDWFAISI